MFLGRNLVTWRNKKYSVMARLSAESEFRSMAFGVCELLWLKIVMEDLHVKWEVPMRLYCDNKSAISFSLIVQLNTIKRSISRSTDTL